MWMSPRLVWIVAPFIWEEEGRPLVLVLEEAEAVKVVCSSRVGRSLKTSRSPWSFMSLQRSNHMGDYHKLIVELRVLRLCLRKHIEPLSFVAGAEQRRIARFFAC